MATKKTKTTAKNNTPAKTQAKSQKPYVYSSTIWNSVGGGLSQPGQSKIVNVGKNKVLLSRSKKLDYYGNPVHTATVINSDGSLGKSFKSNGSATYTVANALKKNGIETKHGGKRKSK